MKISIKNWNKTWGYSGLVGEWHIEVFNAKENSLEERFKHLTQTLEFILPSLQEFHELHNAQIDLSILDKEKNEEKSFIEDMDLESQSISELIPALKEIFGSHNCCLYTKVILELNTIILEKGKKLILPESAELYIGTESFSDSSIQSSLFISYSTFIDVWLSKTLDRNGKERDNSSPAQENKDQLRSFLKRLDEYLVGEIRAGDSHYYAKYINRHGF